ncbi:MAG: hypothetical protein V4581_13415 [Bacteroidota bacterium]
METERKQQVNDNFKKMATKKRVIVFSVLYVFSTALLLMSASNLFTESPFQSRYFVFYILIFVNTMFLARIWRLYLIQKKENKK